MLRKILLAFGLITVLSGCSTINPYTGDQQTSDTTKGVGIGAVGGGIVGGLVGGWKGAAIGAALGGATGGIIGHQMDKQQAELRQRLMGTGVQVQKVGNSVQLVMQSDVTFALNSGDINSSFYSTLDSVAIVLKKYRDTNIVITGYTDNTGTAEHNQSLSEARAASVGNYLISQGVNSNRIFTQGMGERDPVASNDNSDGRSLNRRVVITLRQAA